MTSRFSPSARISYLFGFCVLMLIASVSVSAPAQTKAAATTPATAVCPTGDLSCIKHVVFIMKENRTYDVYFGAYVAKGSQTANGTTTPTLSNGTTITAPHLYDSTPLDICHNWKCDISDMNFGKMDHFDTDPSCTANGILMCEAQLKSMAADPIVSAIPTARVELFEDAGHALFVDDAERFNALLGEFILHLPEH